MARWVGTGGYTVEAIVLNDRQVLRIRCLGYHVAYCRSVAELGRLLDLADLVEVIELPVAAAPG